MGFISRFFAPKDVSDDISSINKIMNVIQALCNTENADVPQLRITFTDTSCNFWFFDCNNCAVSIYQGMIERGQAKEDDIAPLIGKALNVDKLPSDTSITFSHDSSGEVDSYTLQGKIDLRYKNAGNSYISIIEDQCRKNGIQYRRNGSILWFLFCA